MEDETHLCQSHHRRTQAGFLLVVYKLLVLNIWMREGAVVSENSIRHHITGASIGILAGALAGTLPGIFARIAMYVVALEAGRIPQFNIFATLIIIILPAASLGAMLGVFYQGIRVWLPFSQKIFLRGLIFGGLIFILFAAPFFLFEREFVHDIRLSPIVGRFMFFSLPLVYSVALVYIIQNLERRWLKVGEPVSGVEIGRFTLSLAFLVLGILVSILFMGNIVVEASRQIGQPLRRFINEVPIDLSLNLVVGMIFFVTYIPFLLLALFASLNLTWRSFSTLVVGVVSTVALFNIQTQITNPILRRAPQTGAVVVVVWLIICAGSLHKIFPELREKMSNAPFNLSRNTQFLILIVVITEAWLLIASAI